MKAQQNFEISSNMTKYEENPCSILRIAISHEKQEIKKFCDKKFLTRKTGKKNNKLTKVKKALRKASIKRIFEILLKI